MLAIAVMATLGGAPLWVPSEPPAPSPSPVKAHATEDERIRAARLQTALARCGFSPGLIDGKPGRKTRVALEQFRQAKGIEAPAANQSAPDDATLAALNVREVWTRTYKVTEADLALITGPIPTDWNERAALAVSGYETLQELLAERGWCTPETVTWLNPGVVLGDLKTGDEVTLPDVPDPAANPKAAGLPKLARLEVQLSEKIVRGFDDAGTQVSLMHCSIAKSAEKRPVGELKVKVVAVDPEYTFDPKDWPEVEGVTGKLRIAPGPRNPVGAAWVGLDLPGYGMHGTVRPQDIGKTGSHGCFRLANWDALRLAKAVRIGTVVNVVE